jgi:selenocysteine lyase/cysteine desulfurase
MVLIDAAKGCTTEPPNLSLYPADFVVCSFYKVMHNYFVFESLVPDM